MSDLLDTIKTYLATDVDLADIPCYLDMRPETPHKLIVLTELPGIGPIVGGGGAHRAFQAAVRSSEDDPEWAKSTVWKIFNMLTAAMGVFDLRELEVPIELWGILEPEQTPFKIAVDKNNRVIYGFNVSIVTQTD